MALSGSLSHPTNPIGSIKEENLNEFTPTTMLTNNRFEGDADPLWLLTPDELESLPRVAGTREVAIEAITGKKRALSGADEIPQHELTDTRRFRSPDGLQLSLTGWGIRGSELSQFNASGKEGG